MKKTQFYKYQGTGNDFVLIDNRDNFFDRNNQKLIESLCHRRFGIGADGLMLLEKSEKASFTMRYYNSDGRESSMCGNGGRCIAAFATDLGVVNAGESFSFDAVDGMHEALVEGDVVSLKMVDVKGVRVYDEGFFLDTGSPHFIKFVKDPSEIDVYEQGKFWRHHELFAPDGTNVNFVGPVKDGKVIMRTFERGVEDETWSCGTGAVASAIATFVNSGEGNSFVMSVPGGELTVSFNAVDEETFDNIWLKGPAKYVFEGTL
jgi:diaminopimelate epimerase